MKLSRKIGLCGVAAAASLAALVSTNPAGLAATSCSPTATILESPRVASKEVQAKALNDRGDVVGFADSENGSGPIHAILWKGGKGAPAVDLGVPPGYVSSEAYGVNSARVVFGVLYDEQERAFPFRWQDGRMTVLKGPDGRRRQADPSNRNAINDLGEIVATLLVAGDRRAVRWTQDGRASFLPGLPGHAWTDAFSINDDGVVSGWSRKLPSEDGAENPVLWTRSGKVVPLKTAPGRADGIAEATNRSGLTWSATSATSAPTESPECPTPIPNGTTPSSGSRVRPGRVCWGAPLLSMSSKSSWTSTTTARRPVCRAPSRRTGSSLPSPGSGGAAGRP